MVVWLIVIVISSCTNKKKLYTYIMTSYVAQRAASKKAEGMLAPLLDSDEESSLGSDTDSDASSKVETVKQTPMQKLKSLIGTYDFI